MHTTTRPDCHFSHNYSRSLHWEPPCVTMCHSKSAQLSLLGWGEENKGLEQKGQSGGRPANPSHKEGEKVLASWGLPAGEGTEARHRGQEQR